MFADLNRSRALHARRTLRETVAKIKRDFSANAGKYFADACKGELGHDLIPLRAKFIFSAATSLLQILIQLHSFEYGTMLIRYPDFTPVTT
jgi:hypothetical protein